MPSMRRLFSRQRFHVTQGACHRARTAAGFVDLVAGFLQLLVHRVEHRAELAKLGLDRAKRAPHFAGSLLDGQRAEAHLEAGHQRQQRGGAGHGDPQVALQAIDQTRAAQDFRVQAFGGQEHDGELGGVRHRHVLADLLRLLAYRALQRLTRLPGGFRIHALLRVEQALVVLARELGVDRQPDHGIAGGPRETHREFDPLVAARHGGHVRLVLVGREHLLQQAGQLDFAEHGRLLTLCQHRCRPPTSPPAWPMSPAPGGPRQHRGDVAEAFAQARFQVAWSFSSTVARIALACRLSACNELAFQRGTSHRCAGRWRAILQATARWHGAACLPFQAPCGRPRQRGDAIRQARCGVIRRAGR